MSRWGGLRQAAMIHGKQAASLVTCMSLALAYSHAYFLKGLNLNLPFKLTIRDFRNIQSPFLVFSVTDAINKADPCFVIDVIGELAI